MANRINILITCLAGCIVAALFGLLMVFKFRAPFLAMVSAAVFPAVACWISGISNRKQLAKIAAYGAIGWMLASMLRPIVGQTPVLRAARIADLPLLGFEWLLFASFVSTLLALVGAYFAPTGDSSREPDQSQLD